MFTSFTQFLFVVVILFAIAVCLLDRHEVSRHNRELIKENLLLQKANYEDAIAEAVEHRASCNHSHDYTGPTPREALFEYLSRNT